MKICILSDSHDNRKLLDVAVEDAKAAGAQAVLHCGDVVAPTTLRVLQKHGLPVHVIHGNNTGDLYNMTMLAQEPESVVNFYGQDAGMELAGRKIFLVHYPHYARALSTTGEWDLVCCGHDHRVEIREVATIKQTTTVLINPGTVGGVGADPTYVIGDLSTMRFEIHYVPVAESMAYNKPHVTVHD
ncbi:MAG: metallophosphatase family protein [Gammaproteobacteria bacterium]|jgi:putative phosphoesterase|nr:metallophosphatase family protein [Gammaproteobacteria bacterium]